MKKISSILAAILITASLFAQPPQKMTYQAVIRNSSNMLITNKQVGMKISVLQGSASGTAVYTETQTPSTNSNGLVSIEIGGGAGFSAINWASNPYFIKTETDPTGGTNYSIVGTSQLLSVPFALHAKTAETYTETDPLFSVSPASGVSNSDINNWKIAFGWGNHAIANYAAGNHTHTQLHDRNHTMVSTSDHSATPWRMFYSNASGQITEMALGASGLVLKSNGAASAPSWLADNNSGGTVTGTGAASRLAFWDGTSSLLSDGNLNWNNTNNRLGIGVTAPVEQLHVNAGNFLVTGVLNGSPSLTVLGIGTRMFFYPRKAAIRAGQVESTQWNDDKIGTHSVAMGMNTTASGERSTAFGYNTFATGLSSTALGTSTTASGSMSTATGHLTVASGSNSTAIGQGSEASNAATTAIGYYSTASGFASIAMGYRANAVGGNSFAIHLNSDFNAPDVGERAFRISGASSIGGNTAWVNYSDKRLKKDIEQLSTEGNLARILLLNGVRFKWKDNNNILNLGFLAQEVLPIVPESVRYDELNDIYSMEYTALIPVLVEGIKEQQKIIEAQQKQIDELKELVNQHIEK
ncbi:MAG: tail fiber domain-containing protein [Methylotenera sp.]|nr:tail fiber domain-containing protein [Methylotenera sp.]